MRLDDKTYSVTSYEELVIAKTNKEVADKHFHKTLENYLITCVCNAGLANKKVRVKKTGVTGVLRVEKGNFHHEIKFYPFRKDGAVSLKSQYVSGLSTWQVENYHTLLPTLFETVGEEDAG